MNKPKTGAATPDTTETGAAATSKPPEAAPTIEQISAMIEAAAEKVATKPEFVDMIVDAVIAKTDFDKLTSDAVASQLPTSVALKDGIDAAVKAIDLPKLVAETVDHLAGVEARAAEEAAARARADAAAKQRAATAATKKAESDAAQAEDRAAKKRQAAADRAEREYGQMVADPVASAITIRGAASIELRFANGASFLPEFAQDIDGSHVVEEDGHPILMIDVEPSRELVPFQASEAILIVEGGAAGEPLGVWRAEIFPPARIGGGTQVRFPSGSLAFRKVEPAAATEEA